MSKINTSEIYVVNAIPSVIPEAEPVPPLESLKTHNIEENEELHEVLFDEYVDVEERYCGPFTTCIGSILFLIFWPSVLCIGYCPCDKRVVRKKVVRR